MSNYKADPLKELKSNNKLSNSQKIAFQELQRSMNKFMQSMNKPNREGKCQY